MRQLPSPQTSRSFLQALGAVTLGLALFSGTLALLKNPSARSGDPIVKTLYTSVKQPLKPRTDPAEPKVVQDRALQPAQPWRVIQSPRESRDEEQTRLELVEVLKTDPQHIGAAEAFYLIHEKSGDYEGALAALQALEMDTAGAALDYAQARLYLQFGYPEEARLRLERVLESGVDQPLVREHLATAYWDLGKRELAQRQWEELVLNENAGPAIWKAKAKLAELLFLEGRQSEADHYIRDVLQQDPQNRVGVLLSGR